MKHKNTLKQIITTILVAALLITGISLDGTATVNAATDEIKFNPGGNIELKVGDTKRIVLIMKTDTGTEYNLTDQYKWTSSNPDVASVRFVNMDGTKFDHVETIINGSGTAVITCTSKNNPDSTANMTITVKAAKKTAKQKKCKHSWKITKKATCERTGVKTCKKCKWQKTIKKTSHKYSAVTYTETRYKKGYVQIYCTCTTPNAHDVEQCTIENGVECPHQCNFVTTPCETMEEAVAQYRIHNGETISADYPVGHACRGDRDWGEEPYEVEVTEYTCDYCGAVKK